MTKEEALIKLENGFTLKDLSNELQNDKKVVLEADKDPYSYLKYANKRTILAHLQEYNSEAFLYASKKLQNDEDIINEYRMYK